MKIKTLTLGALSTNCYVVMDEQTHKAIVIDPADSPREILNALYALDATLCFVVLTHGHFDHIGAAEELMKKTEAKLICHKEETGTLSSPSINLSGPYGMQPISLTADIPVDDGEEISFGNSRLKVLFTPGHTTGGMSLYGSGVLFSGDTLFFRSIGRSDFPGGDISVLCSSIKNKLFTLPDDTVVYCGHGPSTTICDEKRENFYVR